MVDPVFIDGYRTAQKVLGIARNRQPTLQLIVSIDPSNSSVKILSTLILSELFFFDKICIYFFITITKIKGPCGPLFRSRDNYSVGGLIYERKFIYDLATSVVYMNVGIRANSRRSELHYRA